MHRHIAFFFIFLCFAFFSCNDIVEPDLAKSSIEIVSPTNGLKTTRLTHEFYWNPNPDADGYRIQIARPSFAEVQELVANEDLSENQFEFTFSPGEYEWRIQAYNSASMSDYQTYTIIIDSTLVLNGSRPILSIPSDNFATNDSNVVFEWFDIGVAENYTFYMRTPDFNGNDVVIPVVVTNPRFQLDITLDEGTYQWGVLASNQFSNSDFSTPRTIVFDYTAPSTPLPIFPEENDQLTDSVVAFNWDRPSTGGSAITDSLLIYSDPALQNTINAFSNSSSTRSVSLTKGTYYWRIKSRDEAGNASGYSAIRTFTIN